MKDEFEEGLLNDIKRYKNLQGTSLDLEIIIRWDTIIETLEWVLESYRKIRDKQRETTVLRSNVYRCPVCDKRMPTVDPTNPGTIWCEQCFNDYEEANKDLIERIKSVEIQPLQRKEKKEEDSLEKRRRSDFYDTEDMYEEDE